MKTTKITAIIIAVMLMITALAGCVGCDVQTSNEPTIPATSSDATSDSTTDVTSEPSESSEATVTSASDILTSESAEPSDESTEATTAATTASTTQATTRQTQATTRETTRATSAPTQATQRQATPTPKPTQQTQATQRQATPTPKPTNTPTPTPKPTNTPTPTPKPANLHATADIYWSCSGYTETLDGDTVVRTEHNYDGWIRGVTVSRKSEGKPWRYDTSVADEIMRQVEAVGGSHYSASVENVRDKRP